MAEFNKKIFGNFCYTNFWEFESWNAELPVFTKCFSHTVLIWFPCLVFLIYSPWEYFRLKKRRYFIVNWNQLNIVKLGSLLTLISLNSILFMYILYDDMEIQTYSLAVLSGNCIRIIFQTSAFILIVSHKRSGILSSPLLFWYWCASTIAESIRFYSIVYQLLYLIHDVDLMVLSLQIPAVFLTFLIFTLHFRADHIAKNNLRIHEQNNSGFRLATSSYINQLTFMWILPLIYQGFRKSIEHENVWSLRPTLTANISYKKFMKYWNIQQTRRKNKVSVLKVLLKCYWSYLVIAFAYTFFSYFFQLSITLVLNQFILYISSDEPLWHGILYSIILGIFVYFQDCMIAHSQDIEYSLSGRIRSTLSMALFNKGMKLNCVTRNQYSIGEMVNLLSVDVGKFENGLRNFSQMMVAPFVIGVGLYILWTLIGYAFIGGVVVILLLISTNYFIMNFAHKVQNTIMTLSDKRLSITNEVVSGIKILKLYAWEIPFLENITKIRSKEMKTIKNYNYVCTVNEACWEIGSFSVGLASIAVFVLIDGNILTPNIAFVSLALFNVIKVPMMLFPSAFNALIQTMISIKRLEKFLNSDELDYQTSNDSSSDDPVSVDSSSFTWGAKNDRPVLKDISFNLEKGSLTAVVGKVGSGKSSLVSAILGEMNQSLGKVHKQGRIAYVPQQAWIQNLTVKENILFSESYDQVRYNAVIQACALEPDLREMTAGDETEIGEKGINISGGQKQRVSLARSVYSDADIYLMDDPLSAVDAHVGKHLFENVIGPTGFLKNKTRLLTTNSLTFLHQCDKIILLDDGAIQEIGEYDELLAKSPKFSDLINNYLSNSNNKEDEDVDDTISNDVPSVTFKSQKEISLKDENVHKSGQLIEEEFIEEGEVSWNVYWQYLKLIGPKLVTTSAIGFAGFEAFDVIGKVWLSDWSTDSLHPEQENHSTSFRLGIFGMFGLLSGIHLLLGYLSYMFGHVHACFNLHTRMLNSIMFSPMSFFDTTPIGRIMNRFSSDTNIIDLQLFEFIRLFLLFSSIMLGTFVIIVIQIPLFILVLVPLAVLYIFIQKAYLRTSRQLKRIEAVTKSPIYSLYSESVIGADSIRAYGCVQRFVDQFEKKIDTHSAAHILGLLTSRWLDSSGLVVGALVVLCTSLLSAISRGSLDPGAVGLVVTFAINVTFHLNICMLLTSEIETNIVSAERIIEYSKISTEAPYKIPEKKLPSHWPDNGSLQLVNYNTKYRPNLDLILKDLSLDIQPGEKIGVCGRTGAGKSSLTLALFRIIEAHSGRIDIDSKDISTIGLYDLRSKLTIIPQDPILFTGSLRFNLDPLNIHFDDEIWESLEYSHLRNFVKTLNGGLDFEVSESGSNLSVGQRQLVCLARALLRNTKVLILDEATAAIDLETDDLIQRTIRDRFKDSTVVTIAHRLNTIVDSDRILVLQNGQIKEFDSPSVLLEDKNSVFYSMIQDSSSKT